MWTLQFIAMIPICDVNNWWYQNDEDYVIAVAVWTSSNPSSMRGRCIKLFVKSCSHLLRQRQRQRQRKNGLHWTLEKCSHGDLRQRQRKPIGSDTIHSFRCRCRSQCERSLSLQATCFKHLLLFTFPGVKLNCTSHNCARRLLWKIKISVTSQTSPVFWSEIAFTFA